MMKLWEVETLNDLQLFIEHYYIVVFSVTAILFLLLKLPAMVASLNLLSRLAAAVAGAKPKLYRYKSGSPFGALVGLAAIVGWWCMHLPLQESYVEEDMSLTLSDHIFLRNFLATVPIICYLLLVRLPLSILTDVPRSLSSLVSGHSLVTTDYRFLIPIPKSIIAVTCGVLVSQFLVRISWPFLRPHPGIGLPGHCIRPFLYPAFFLLIPILLQMGMSYTFFGRAPKPSTSGRTTRRVIRTYLLIAVVMTAAMVVLSLYLKLATLGDYE